MAPRDSPVLEHPTSEERSPSADRKKIDPDAVAGMGFTEFYRVTIASLVSFLIVQGATLADATDAAQDAMAEAYRTWSSIDHPRAWVYRVASRALIRRERKQNRDAPWGSAVDVADLAETAAEEPFDEVLDMVAIGDLVDRIPAEMREAAILRADGYSTREIAQQMGIPRSAVVAHLSGLRSRLRALEPEQRPVRRPAVEAKRLSLLDQAVNALPLRRREVLTRQLFRGLQPKEIAAELNISANCARVHLNLAYTELAHRVGADRAMLVKALKPMRGQPAS